MADKEGAIPGDAPKKDPNDPLQRLSRAEAMEAVLGTRKGTLANDGVGDEPPEVDLDPEAQVERQSNEPLVLSDEDLGKYLVRTKVNGEEKMVPLDQLRATAQKTEAADRFLAEAKAILSDAKAKAAEAPVAPVAPTATPEPVPTGPDPFDVAVDSMFQGNDQDAKRNFREAVLKAVKDGVSAMQPTQVAPAPDLQQLASAIEQSIEVKSALRQFAKDYPDIVADPKARRDADEFLMEVTEGKPLEAFPAEKIHELLDETGKRMRSWFRERAGVPANSSQATTRDEKALRKEAIDELPSAATRAATTESLPKTPSDIIGAMKERRGQQFRDPTQT